MTLQSTPLTTGTAQATVKHADDSDQNINGAAISATRLDCAALARSDVGPFKLVGAVPTLNTFVLVGAGVTLDTLTGFTLECE